MVAGVGGSPLWSRGLSDSPRSKCSDVANTLESTSFLLGVFPIMFLVLKRDEKQRPTFGTCRKLTSSLEPSVYGADSNTRLSLDSFEHFL
ncbi:hypothetical protein BT67DRAFT_247645 [Trichocladium antarcticum]|uniref:Uncharacterized protein n=1 Tax=Trichocladium antarcticum TaxID=1450529 RepID=A0AAN6Z8T1_9PEZI|nr:hypothetical protein BT67DRAFT_247645 [Trichocladium antarcticum]